MTALEPLDGDHAVPVPVDPPAGRRQIDATVLVSRVVDKRPVVPPWLRNRADARALAAWLARYGVHVSMFHTVRSPMYLARLVARSPRGGWRVVCALFGWVFDHEQAPLRADAVRRNSTSEYMTLSKQRNTRVRQRGAVVLVGAVVLAVAVVVLRIAGPGWVQAAVIVVVVGTLGVVGTTADRRVLDVATVSPFAPPRLTAPSVVRALQALGISGMAAKDAELSFPAPITRDGPGWRADVDLPHGITPGW